jgi:hypothetical protein
LLAVDRVRIPAREALPVNNQQIWGISTTPSYE